MAARGEGPLVQKDAALSVPELSLHLGPGYPLQNSLALLQVSLPGEVALVEDGTA